jgi:hypothetical protein
MSCTDVHSHVRCCKDVPADTVGSALGLELDFMVGGLELELRVGFRVAVGLVVGLPENMGVGAAVVLAGRLAVGLDVMTPDGVEAALGAEGSTKR